MIKRIFWIILFFVHLFGCGSPPPEDAFRYRLSTTPVSLDPAHAVDAAGLTVIQELFDGLVAMDAVTGEAVPCIASSWEISESGKVWKFLLKDSVFFHNGDKMTADDFCYSFERVLDPKTRCERTWVLEPLLGAKEFMAGSAAHIKGIRVPDSLTLELELAEPFAPFLSHLAMEIASVVSPRAAKKQGKNFGRHPCGTGPYQLEEYLYDNKITLKAFAKHHQGEPAVGKIEYRVVPNDLVAYEQYKSGKLDLLNPVPSGQVSIIRKKRSVEFRQWPILELRYLGMNLEKEPFKSHPKVRKAVSLALNRKGISETIYEGVVQPACRILPPGLGGSEADTSCAAYLPDSAKQLLREAGFPDGKGLPELTLLYNSREIETRLWQYVKACLEETGFKIKLKALEWGTFLEAVRNGECDLFRGSWVADYPDPHNFLHVLFYSENKGSAGNYSRYSNPAYDTVVEKAKTETDPAIRKSLYQKAEEMIRRDVPVCPLFFGGDAVLFSKAYAGFITPSQGVWAVPLDRIKKAEESRFKNNE